MTRMKIQTENKVHTVTNSGSGSDSNSKTDSDSGFGFGFGLVSDSGSASKADSGFGFRFGFGFGRSALVLLSALLGAAVLLGGCQPATLDDLMQGRKIDYADESKQRGKTLAHPPDIISDALTRGGGGEGDDDGVSLSEYRVEDVPEVEEDAGRVAPEGKSAKVALRGGGNLLWLEAEMTPDEAWETARSFWGKLGFALEKDEPKLGYMETEWLEIRALRSFGLGGLFDDFLDRIRDSGQRDKFRTRIDPADERDGARIYIAHQHITEVYDLRREGTRAGFQALPSDPHLEAEMLRRMLLYFSGEEVESETEKAEGEEVALVDEESDADAESDSESDSDSESEEGDGEETSEEEEAPVEIGEDYDLRGDSLLIKKPLREAYLLVRIGLDRGGFTLEDRDVSEASFYIRHSGGPESDRIFGASEEGFFNRLFVRAEPVVRDIKIQLTAEGEHSAARALAADDEGDLTAEQSESLLRLLAENLP